MDYGVIYPIYFNSDIIKDLSTVFINTYFEKREISTTTSKGVKGKFSDSSSETSKISVPSDKGEKGNDASISTKSELDLEGDSDLKRQIKDTKGFAITNVFFNLRDRLLTNELLKVMDDENLNEDDLKVGNLIEISGKLRKNPIMEYDEMIKMLKKSEEVYKDSDVFGIDKALSVDEKSELKWFSQILNMKELKQSVCPVTDKDDRSVEDYFDLLGECNSKLNGENLNLLILAKKKYFAGEEFCKIIGSEFKIIGKLVECASNRTDKKVNLFRGHPFEYVSDEKFNFIKGCFLKLKEQGIIKKEGLPEFNQYINPPVISIEPIAIYLS